MSACLVCYEQIGEMASILPTEEKRYFACRDLIQANIVSLMARYENHLNKDSVHNWNCVVEEWSGGFKSYGEWLQAAVTTAECKKHGYDDGYSVMIQDNNYLIQQMGYIRNWKYQSCEMDDHKKTEGWKISNAINSLCLEELLENNNLNVWEWNPEELEIMDESEVN